jgi:hypothetical protein
MVHAHMQWSHPLVENFCRLDRRQCDVDALSDEEGKVLLKESRPQHVLIHACKTWAAISVLIVIIGVVGSTLSSPKSALWIQAGWTDTCTYVCIIRIIKLIIIKLLLNPM